ncbi:ankyrin repeat domain-containing protein [Campylobacter ureolyticus]|uniref:Ankyrin repeats (3 copies) n=1 Tax=Campylobacter ureolyticus TaxID=827 RepID=A0A6N2SRC6_9BACT
MKNKFLNSFIIITLISVAFIVYNKFKLSQNSHFTVTADTVIKPGSEISKYVTQEEVDSFALRYWDIDNNYTEFVNPIAIPLRDALKKKHTNKVLSYLKDNNLSVDIEIEDGTTPLMYSSFYNDLNTTKELIKLGADIHKKDKYGLSPMAYAISMNSLNVIKLFYESGVKFEEAPITQGYILSPSYPNIDKLVINGNDIKIVYKYNWIQKDYDTPKGYGYMFEDVVFKNWIELAKFILESGYKPYSYFTIGDTIKYGYSIYDLFTKEDIDDLMILAKQSKRDMFDYNLSMDELRYSHSLYKRLEKIPNFEPMLDLLLEHNVSGQPSKELMKSEYENCYKIYILSIIGAIDIDDKGNYFLKYNSMSRNVYQKYCSKDYANFKNIKDYIKFKNDLRLTDKLEDILFSTQKNRVIFVDKNQTDYIIEPYKQLSSDELKEIYEYYYYKGGREKIQEIYIF